MRKNALGAIAKAVSTRKLRKSGYCTVLACILIQLISGKKPNIAMRRMISWYLLGVATEAEVMAWLNKPDNKGVKLRAKEELWKKLGY